MLPAICQCNCPIPLVTNTLKQCLENFFVSMQCGGNGDGEREPVVYPLRVEVYEPEDANLLTRAGWKPSSISDYSRSHGL